MVCGDPPLETAPIILLLLKPEQLYVVSCKALETVENHFITKALHNLDQCCWWAWTAAALLRGTCLLTRQLHGDSSRAVAHRTGHGGTSTQGGVRTERQ